MLFTESATSVRLRSEIKCHSRSFVNTFSLVPLGGSLTSGSERLHGESPGQLAKDVFGGGAAGAAAGVSKANEPC